MKRNIFFISVLAALISAGCSKNEPAVLTQESVSKEIDFSSNLKGEDTKSGPLGQSFRVEAFLSGIPSGKTARDVFFPSTAYRYNSGKYTGDTTKYAYDYVSSDVTIPVNTSTAIPVGEAKCLLPSQAAKLKAVVKYKILDSSDSVLEDNTSDGIEVTLSSEDWIAEKQIITEHVFSVSATKQVKFTKGNLYWDGTAPTPACLTAVRGPEKKQRTS